MPLVSYIYAASKQISAAISPGNDDQKFQALPLMFWNLLKPFHTLFIDQSSNAFKEVAIIRHPRIGEYAFGFITSTVILQHSVGEEELCCVYVPSNHLYIGDIFLTSSNDILRPNLSVREGIGTTFFEKIFRTLYKLLTSFMNIMIIRFVWFYVMQKLLYPEVCQYPKYWLQWTHKPPQVEELASSEHQ